VETNNEESTLYLWLNSVGVIHWYSCEDEETFVDVERRGGGDDEEGCGVNGGSATFLQLLHTVRTLEGDNMDRNILPLRNRHETNCTHRWRHSIAPSTTSSVVSVFKFISRGGEDPHMPNSCTSVLHLHIFMQHTHDCLKHLNLR